MRELQNAGDLDKIEEMYNTGEIMGLQEEETEMEIQTKNMMKWMNQNTNHNKEKEHW